METHCSLDRDHQQPQYLAAPVQQQARQASRLALGHPQTLGPSAPTGSGYWNPWSLQCTAPGILPVFKAHGFLSSAAHSFCHFHTSVPDPGHSQELCSCLSQLA